MTGSQRPGAVAVEKVTHRQALHAAALRFAHPETRVWQEFMVDWPDDLRPCLAMASGDDALLAGESALDYLGFPALG